MKTALFFGLVLFATSAKAQVTQAASARDMGGGRCANNPYNCADAVNPVPTPNTVWMEEMTWMDVRDALKAGKTTAIIATGTADTMMNGSTQDWNSTTMRQ